jgi:hypothetical protein
MLAHIRDWHQNLSWNVGYRRGNESLPFRCPWWADREICALAYLQGKGADLTDAAIAAKQNVADTQKVLDSLRDLDIKQRN